MESLEQKEKDKSQFRFFRVLLIVLFSIAMIGGMVLGLFLFKLRPEVSELEKRKLTAFPEITWASFWDGSYEEALSTWFSDTFPLRERMLRTEQRIRTLYGFQKDSVQHVADGDDIPDIDDPVDPSSGPDLPPGPVGPSSEPVTEPPEEPTEPMLSGDEIARMNPQEAGTVNVLDLVGYSVYGFNTPSADQYCRDVANMAAAVKGTAKVYEILIPNNSAIMLSDEVKAQWKLSDEKKVIRYYTGRTHQMDPEVVTVDLYDALYSHRDEYIYYKTDHHWTQLGAYYAYREFCKAASLTPHELSDYKVIDSGNFVGSYYSSNGFAQLLDNPDRCVSYEPVSTNEFEFFDLYQNAMRKGKMVRDMSQFNDNVKFMGYIYGDNPYSHAHNDTIKNGRKCIVIKESFGNPFVPFLIDHFEDVYVCDYRTYKEAVSVLAKENGVTDIILINNLEAISDKPTMDVLGNICK